MLGEARWESQLDPDVLTARSAARAIRGVRSGCPRRSACTTRHDAFIREIVQDVCHRAVCASLACPARARPAAQRSVLSPGPEDDGVSCYAALSKGTDGTHSALGGTGPLHGLRFVLGGDVVELERDAFSLSIHGKGRCAAPASFDLPDVVRAYLAMHPIKHCGDQGFERLVAASFWGSRTRPDSLL